MTTKITFDAESKDAILRLANATAKQENIFVLLDTENDDMVIAAMQPKTFLGTIADAIKAEIAITDTDEVGKIHMIFRNHDYSIECQCDCVIDGEETKREFSITMASMYK